MFLHSVCPIWCHIMALFVTCLRLPPFLECKLQNRESVMDLFVTCLRLPPFLECKLQNRESVMDLFVACLLSASLPRM